MLTNVYGVLTLLFYSHRPNYNNNNNNNNNNIINMIKISKLAELTYM